MDDNENDLHLKNYRYNSHNLNIYINTGITMQTNNSRIITMCVIYFKYTCNN